MSCEIIPFHEKQPVTQACSFCKQPEPKVKKLIQGLNGHCICDKCIAKATALMSRTAAEVA